MDDLIANFHALEGDTLQEKRKSFNRLLAKIEQELTTDEDLNAFVSGLTPRSRLEEILKVEILLRFQRNVALLDVLKSGDVIFIRKVLNCWKFFESAFVDIDADTLVNEVFLHVSFSTRMKTITKLATNIKSETLADSYFTAIRAKYGLHAASAILPACSLNLIKSTIEMFKVKLSERQLLKIFRKHQEFLIYYFQVLHKDNETLCEYNTVLKQVARVNAELFWKIREKYNIDVKFGRHMTSYMFVDDHGKKYGAKNFNPKKVYAITKRDEHKLRQYLLNLYPEDIQDFYPQYSRYHDNTLTKFIGYMPRIKRYAIVSACFKELYGENVSEYDRDNMPINFLKIMPVEVRKTIIDQKVLKDESCTYMWPADEAITAIKERIKYTTDKSQRQQFVLEMYRTCIFNHDQTALLNVLKYVRSRCRNNETLLISFVNQLSEWKYLERLSDEHWTHIKELVKPLLINVRLYTDFKFIVSYLKHRMDTGDQNDEFLKLFLKKMTERRSLCHVFNEKNKFGKRLLEYVAALIPKMFEGDEYQETAVCLLWILVLYNKQNSRHRIPLSNYPNFVQVAKSYVAKEDRYEIIDIMKYCIQYEYHTDDDYDSIFWKYYDKLYDANILLWYLRNKPLRVLQNIDEVLKHTSTHVLTYRLDSIFKYISMHAFCGETEKIVDFAKNSLKVDNAYTANFAIKALSYLTDSQSYFESMRFLHPAEDGKIDYEQVNKKQLEIQESFAKSLIGIQNPSLCLPSLLTFCKGDYLKYAYRPLYYISTHIPETDFDRLFETLFNSAVSVRKHAVYLVTVVCSKEKIYGFLKQVGESDNHATIQKVVFKSTLKYFLADQSEIFWNLLQCNIKIIDMDDTEAYEHLINLEKIPSNYLPQYIQLAYEILTQHESKQIQNKKSNLLSGIPNDTIKDLSKEFLQKVIVETLFTQNHGHFWLNCVFYTTGQNQEAMLLFSFDLFKNYYNRHLPDSASSLSKEVLRNVDDFVSDFCQRATVSNTGETLIRKFIECWSETVIRKEFHEDLQLQLQLTENYLACHSDDKLCEFVDTVNVLLVNWVEEHGDASVVHLFAEKLETLLFSITNGWKNNEEFMKFLEKFCSADDFPYNSNYIVAMKLLSAQKNSKNFKVNFGNLIARLRQANVPSLRIRLGQLLKCLVA